MLRIGWFSTGRDKAAWQLLEATCQNTQKGEIEAQIIFVFSNREPGENKESDLFFKLVQSYHLPLVCFSYRRFKDLKGVEDIAIGDKLPPWRLEYDREVMKRLNSLEPDLCLLAGYMLIVGPEMCRKYSMINLHPAAPGGPSGSWQNVIWSLIDSKANESGVMMHLVTPELDRGPVVTYCTFCIKGEPFQNYWQRPETYPTLFQLIRYYGLAREFPLIIATLKLLSQGIIRIEAGRKVNSQGRPVIGYNLTPEIDKIIKIK